MTLTQIIMQGLRNNVGECDALCNNFPQDMDSNICGPQ